MRFSMSLRTVFALAVCAVLALLTGSATTIAYDDAMRYPFLERLQRMPTYVQPRRPPAARPYYERPHYYGRPAPRYYESAPRWVERPAPVRRRAKPAVVVRENVVKPKVNPSTFVVVMGDTLAESLNQGLDLAFEERPDVSVTRKTKADSGLARSDIYDWPKAARDILSGTDKITIGVMMVGANDRQPLKEGEETIEPGSDRWNEIYGRRIDDIVKGFADRKIPLVWVGALPMKNEKLSTDMAALNNLYRDRVQRSGGIFVDVWEAFVDADNRYSAYGPDVSGENTKLRTNDGVHFTKAGARKLAHFVDIEIKRLVDGRQPDAMAGLPPIGAPADVGGAPLSPERLIDQAMVTLPEPPGVVAIPQKPLAGPVLPLTRPDLAPNGVLASAPAKKVGDASALIERVFGEGRSPEPRPGRADDFRWPRQGS